MPVEDCDAKNLGCSCKKGIRRPRMFYFNQMGHTRKDIKSWIGACLPTEIVSHPLLTASKMQLYMQKPKWTISRFSSQELYMVCSYDKNNLKFVRILDSNNFLGRCVCVQELLQFNVIWCCNPPAKEPRVSGQPTRSPVDGVKQWEGPEKMFFFLSRKKI